jgi:hypothetical protein
VLEYSWAGGRGRAAGCWSTHGRADGDRRLKARLEVDWDRRRVEQQRVDLRQTTESRGSGQQRITARDSSGSTKLREVSAKTDSRAGNRTAQSQRCGPRVLHCATVAASRCCSVACCTLDCIVATAVATTHVDEQPAAQVRIGKRRLGRTDLRQAKNHPEWETMLTGMPRYVGNHAKWDTTLSGISC